MPSSASFTTSPKLVVNDRFLARENAKKKGTGDDSTGKFTGDLNPSTNSGSTLLSPSVNNEKSVEEKMRAWRIEYAIHMIIPLYGLGVLVLVLSNYF